ncbi:MAG TPA: FxLYD domain-containing protein [Bryobacteraceae bacterium]|nr:FxLYD domain-containing protein [Bryobacteraceae bacterium]
MAEGKAAVSQETRLGIPPMALIIGVVLVLGAAGFLYLDHLSKQPAPPPPPLTGDAKTYVRNLKLSGVEMAAHEDYFKQKVVEITGMIQNAGDRVLQVVEINCVFYDPYGQVVLRQRVPIVSQKAGGLAPGETKPFRLPFDNLPDSWNNVMPQMVIARIDFQ